MELKRFIPLAFMAICLLLSSSFAYAQEMGTESYTTAKTKKFNFPPYEEIDPLLLEEMNQVYNSCSVDPNRNGYRDCKCYAMAYLEERIKTPSVEPQLVFNAIERECFDPEKMKGHFFGYCAGGSYAKRGASKGKDPVEFCNCFANYVTDNLLKMKKFYSTAVQSLQGYATKACR